MSDLEAEFAKARSDVQTLSHTPSNDNLLALYAHYKQATKSDVSGKRPPVTDLDERVKHDAWAALKGLTTEQAMQGYITKVGALLDAEHG